MRQTKSSYIQPRARVIIIIIITREQITITSLYTTLYIHKIQTYEISLKNVKEENTNSTKPHTHTIKYSSIQFSTNVRACFTVGRSRALFGGSHNIVLIAF